MATMTTGTFSPEDVRQMIDTRRDLHAHPELAFEEVRTSKLVADRLRAYGLEPRTGIGKTGVVAIAQGGRAGKTVLLRADMDALPIQEDNDVPYRSSNAGRMHACGHDCHTSILLGIAKQIAANRSSLPGKTVLCFQPAEETGGGANSMIEDGVLKDPKPDAAFGVHVWQELDVGKVGVTVGPMLAAVDEFEVTITGKGTHAAAPHYGIDPILCMAHVVTALQAIASREVDPLLQAVVSVTQIKAGTAFNIIPDNAWMNGTVRVFDKQVWEELPGRFERIVKGVASAMGCTANIQYERHNGPTINDPEMAAIARRAAIEVVGERNVVDTIRTMGGEDFSSFLLQVPGCFLAIGSRNTARGLTYSHHHPRFDVDEGCLEIGAEVLLRCARTFLES
jgi:amidohydrolase